MDIKKKCIINPQRYLQALQSSDKFYIAIPLTDADHSRLSHYGLFADTPARIPIPRAAATSKNANGSWKILRDLPREKRSIERDYHIIDWHGTDHYGTCWQDRWCYQRELIPPLELAFVIEDNVLYSPLLTYDESEIDRIKTAMNVALEMAGHFQIWSAAKAPALPPIKQIEVPWEILRPGTNCQRDWMRYVDKIIQQKPQPQQEAIRNRHKYLWSMAPDFCVLGRQNFWGYVVYSYTSANLFVFECNEINNATYVFKGDWISASQLTKTEVISAHAQEARIYHTMKWKDNISSLITGVNKEMN